MWAAHCWYLIDISVSILALLTLLNSYVLIFFFLRGFLSISLVTLFKTHSIMLNEMMRVIILALFPVLGELTQYFTLNTILAIDFSQMLFYQVEEIPYFLPSWLKLFPKWVLYLFSIFCVYWKDYIFFIFSINIISCDNQ